MNRILHLAARVLAGLLVLAVLVVPVVVVARLVGNPFGGDLFNRLRDQRADDATLQRLISIAFYGLWGWFAFPALRQAYVCLTARRERQHTATRRAPAVPVVVERGPQGWLARLVHYALTSSTIAFAATSTSLIVAPAAVASSPPVHAGPSAAARTEVHAQPSRPTTTATDTCIAQRRDTPWSIACRLFPDRPEEAREEILELNRGRPTPNGGAYQGGTFPVGMLVLTPDYEPAPTPEPQTAPADTAVHVIEPGDTVWAVTEAYYGNTLPQVVEAVAAASGIADPHRIMPGQELLLPASAALDVMKTHVVDAALRVVEPGDTLWQIVEDHYGTADRELVEHIARINGLDDPNLILPGQTINLDEASVAEPSPSEPGIVEPSETPTVDPVGPPDPAPAPAEDAGGPPPTAAPVDPPDAAPDEPPVPAPATGPAESEIEPEASDAPASPNGGAAAEPSPAAGAPVPFPVPMPVPAPAPDRNGDVGEPGAVAPTNDDVRTPVATGGVPVVPASPASVGVPVTQPGDVAATPSEPVRASAGEDSSTLSTITQLAAGGLSLAGLVALLDHRRRRRRTRRPAGHTVEPPTGEQATTETVLRRTARLDLAERVNAAVRSLGPDLARRDTAVRARYLLADDDSITVVLATEHPPPAGWASGMDPNTWVCQLTDAELANVTVDWSPWPAVLPLGTLDDGRHVLIDLEGAGIVSLAGDRAAARAVLAAATASLATSPYTDMLTLLDDDLIGSHRLDDLLPNKLRLSGPDELIDRLSAWVAPFIDSATHIVAARAEWAADWEPCIAAMATRLDDAHRHALAGFDYGTHPIALITTDTELGRLRLDIAADHTTTLDGHTVRCHYLEPAAAEAIADLIVAADLEAVSNITPLERFEAVQVASPLEHTPAAQDGAIHQLVVEPLGGESASEGRATFESETDGGAEWRIGILGDITITHSRGHHLPRPRARELLTLLALYPHGLTGHQLELMLFPDQLGNASIKPRISELRNALGLGDTEAGRRFLPPAVTNRYRVDNVRLDADDFFALLKAASITTNTQERINALAGALQLVRGTIGTGEATSWGWASQHLATIEAAIIDAGLELAELATLQQNWRLADWAATRTQVANPHEQRGLPYAIRARRELGDRVGIQRLHDTTTAAVDELDDAAASAFYEALAKGA